MTRFAVCLLALGATTTVARAGVEIGGSAGLHVFSTSNGLGVADGSSDSLKNSSIFLLRVGYYPNEHLGVEVESGAIPTEPSSTVFDVDVFVARANLVYQLAPTTSDKSLIPFALVGAGIDKIVYSVNTTIISKETNFVPYAGIGIKYRTGGGWSVRADARLLIPPSSSKSETVDFEALLSLSREFGGKKFVRHVEEPPAKKDEDPDHDGIFGAADKCPNQPEDKDGFQDADGCPDPDNDGDGIPDEKDKCPNEAEDKDGFQDDDGCPDPDNDGDGIPDAADKCPDQPETKNGYQDEDGCPDEIPEKLKQFTGVIQGINFKTSAADLAPGSTVTLDKAVAVLAEFKDIKLEIQGHTDDQPVTSKAFADNTALSQARAETVKAYMVKKGIDESRLVAKGYGDSLPVEDPKPLKGQALNAARTKNRRVEFKLVTSATPPVAAPPAPTPAAAPAAPATVPPSPRT